MGGCRLGLLGHSVEAKKSVSTNFCFKMGCSRALMLKIAVVLVFVCGKDGVQVFSLVNDGNTHARFVFLGFV